MGGVEAACPGFFLTGGDIKFEEGWFAQMAGGFRVG
jgi:hypothetical protein